LKLGTDFPSESEVNNPLNSLLAYNPSASDQVVDGLLISDLAETTDAYIDLLLSQIYKTPLQLTSDITVGVLASISEGLILSHLIAVHFQGTPGIIASDTSNASADFRRGAEFLLSQILAGSGVFFPQSIQSPAPNINVPEATPLRLPGEILLGQSERPDTISRNYSFVSKRNTQSGGNFFNDRCSGCAPRPDGTSLGSTPKTYDICNPNNPYPDYEVFQ
jgi:hypothetical protein